MLIFDGFPDRKSAEKFAHTIRTLDIQANVCDSQEESNKIDIFPFTLYPPIVLVERGKIKDEEIVRIAELHKGVFAGT